MFMYVSRPVALAVIYFLHITERVVVKIYSDYTSLKYQHRINRKVVELLKVETTVHRCLQI